MRKIKAVKKKEDKPVCNFCKTTDYFISEGFIKIIQEHSNLLGGDELNSIISLKD